MTNAFFTRCSCCDHRLAMTKLEPLVITSGTGEVITEHLCGECMPESDRERSSPSEFKCSVCDDTDSDCDYCHDWDALQRMYDDARAEWQADLKEIF